MADHPTCHRDAFQSHFCSLCQVRGESVCAALSDAELEQVAKTMAHLPVKQDEAVIEQGAEVDNLYVVVSGAFRLVRVLADGRRQITGFVFPSDFLGLVANEPSAYSAEALEPSLVCRFSHAFLSDLSQKHPGVKDRLIAKGQNELTKAQHHIVLLGKSTAEERVLAFLQTLSERATPNEDGAVEIYLPMSRQDIADYLGLRMETLSRTLAALKKSRKLSAVAGRSVTLSALGVEQQQFA